MYPKERPSSGVFLKKRPPCMNLTWALLVGFCFKNAQNAPRPPSSCMGSRNSVGSLSIHNQRVAIFTYCTISKQGALKRLHFRAFWAIFRAIWGLFEEDFEWKCPGPEGCRSVLKNYRLSSGDGTRTAAIPAAAAACKPISVSSNTRQSAGATPSRSAAIRNASGAGLLRA